MTRRIARTALAVVVSAAAIVASGCGREAVVTHAATEGIWVNAGSLDYHVEGSRVLEPGLVPDKSYLVGLPQGTQQPTSDEVWFAVFLRVQNTLGKTAPTARRFEIVDTEGKIYRPITLDRASNPFAYEPTKLADGKVVPEPDSVQALDSFQGALLLFKIPLDSYANRPLQFRIHSEDGEPNVASVNLDV